MIEVDAVSVADIDIIDPKANLRKKDRKENNY